MKTILKRISAGVLAAVFLATFAVPRSRAVVADLDIVAVANAVVNTHLAALGGEFAVKAGGSSALAAGTESLFTQAGVAGAFGAGVTGATAMGTIAAGVAAFGGGFMLGYEGYQVVTQFVDWLKANGIISAGETAKIYVSGGSWDTLSDGTIIENYSGHKTPYVEGVWYRTQAGSAWTVTIEKGDNRSRVVTVTGLSVDNRIVTHKTNPYSADGPSGDGQYYMGPVGRNRILLKEYCCSGVAVSCPPNPAPEGSWDGVFGVTSGTSVEKREVTYTSPATWTPPAPKPGQSVLYKPFPNAPDKGLEDIIADVPESIASGNFKPATTTVIETPTPEPPPTPDVPPTVNPNPDVQAPEDVTPYTVKIGEVFPFCIPFDLYHMVTMFSAEPEAPHAKWTFSLPWAPQQEYKVEWDLKKFDELAELCRKLELVLFCVGLAVVTSKLIKW